MGPYSFTVIRSSNLRSNCLALGERFVLSQLDLIAYRKRLEHELTRVTAEADRAVGVTPIEPAAEQRPDAAA